MLSAPRIARANSGNFLETIGLGIAVGTVLGASTLPFYDQPGTHANNLAYGASIGAATGVGVLFYSLVAGHNADDYDNARLQNQNSAINLAQFKLRTQSVYPALIWSPLVSLTW